MIRKLCLTWWFQHAAREVTFGPGLTAVVGPNACGKSNALAGLFYALTGDPELAAGAGLDAAAEVVLDTPGGVPAVLKRVPGRAEGRKPATRSLAVGDEPPAVVDRDVAARVQQWFGVPPAVLADLAYRRQGEIHRPAVWPPAERRRQVSALLGLEAAARAYAALNPGPTRPPPDDPAPLEAEARRLAAAAAAAGAEAPADSQDQTAALVEAAQAWSRHTLEVSSWRAAKTQADGAVAALDAARDGLRKAEAALADADRFADAGKQAELILDAHRQWETRQGLEAEYAAAEAERVQSGDELRLTPHPGDPPAPSAQLVELAGFERTDRALVELADDVCPTCGGAAVSLAERKAEAAVRLAAIAALRLQEKDRSDAYRRQLRTFDLADDRHRRACERFRLAEAKLASAPVGARCSHPTDSLERLIDYGWTAAASRLALAQAVLVAQAEVVRLEVTAARPVGPPPAEPAGPADAADRLTRLRDLDRRSSAAAYEAHAAAVRAEAARKAWDEYQADREYRADVEAARAAFHPTAAPADVAAAFLAALVDPANAYLAAFRADFRLAPDGADWYVARYGDRDCPPARLSGAEQLLFGLAWWLAVLDAARIPLLVLDEPTYGLDASRMDALAAALDGWKRAAAGRQLVVVTHDRRLADVADFLTDLSPP